MYEVLETPRLIVLEDFNIHIKDTLLRLVRDFTLSLTALGLSQIVTGPKHKRGRILYLTFCAEHVREGLVSGLDICSEPWSGYYLLKAKVNVTPAPCMRVGPGRFMNPTGFQNAL